MTESQSSKRSVPDEQSIFDDPLMTPPTTDAKTGTWDDDGSIRGWTFQPDCRGSFIHDYILEKQWTLKGLTCLLIRVTEYVERGKHTKESPDYGEFETYYRGFVHAPSVESFPAGYCGVYVTDCYPDDGWYEWDERKWSNRSGRTQSMRESALGKTRTLAKGLAKQSSKQSAETDEESQ